MWFAIPCMFTASGAKAGMSPRTLLKTVYKKNLIEVLPNLMTFGAICVTSGTLIKLSESQFPHP